MIKVLLATLFCNFAEADDSLQRIRVLESSTQFDEAVENKQVFVDFGKSLRLPKEKGIQWSVKQIEKTGTSTELLGDYTTTSYKAQIQEAGKGESQPENSSSQSGNL